MKNQNKECNGTLYTSDGKTFLKLWDQKCCYYTVEDGTESIAENAFAGLSYSNKIEYLNLPDSIVELGKGAFQRMALNSIAIPPQGNRSTGKVIVRLYQS